MGVSRPIDARELTRLSASCWPMVLVVRADRLEFGRALVLQGYAPERAAELASDLADTDGALQMLARHRLASSFGLID